MTHAVAGNDSQGSPRFDYLFKCVIVGESGVGKTNLLTRFSDDRFSEETTETIGVDFKFSSTIVQGRRLRLQIWDTAGQERFKGITNSYYRCSHGVVLVFDVTDWKSFSKVETWLTNIANVAPAMTPIILVGNKTDMDKRVVSMDLAKEFSEKHGLEYMETSAKSGLGVREMFQEMATRMHANMTQEVEDFRLKVKAGAKCKKPRNCNCIIQ